jgi:hypothetical protein
MNVVGDCLYGAMFTNHFSNRRIPYERQAADIMDLLMNGVFTSVSREETMTALRRPSWMPRAFLALRVGSPE